MRKILLALLALVFVFGGGPALAQDAGTIQAVIQQDFGAPVNVVPKPVANQVLQFNGKQWVAATAGGATTSNLAVVMANTPNPGVTGGTSLTFTTGDNIILATSGAGTQIGTGATQLLAFYGATPVVQQAGNSDVLGSLVTLGLRAASSNPPLNLGTGSLTAGASTLGATTVTTLGTAGNVTLSDGNNIIVGASTGTQIATGATQKLGFYGAAPVAQISGSTDVLAGLVTLGFRAASSNPPLNMGTGTLTCGPENTTGTMTSTLGTVTVNTPTLTSTETWNAGGVTFQGLLLNVTNTASAAASRVFTYQVGGTSQFAMDTGGNVLANDSGVALLTNATKGFFYLPSSAGAPSGTPGLLPTGANPCEWDSTNLKLMVYSGGAWNPALPNAATPTLGAVVNAGNVVNSVAASGQITWGTGGTYSAPAPEIQFPTDQVGYITGGSGGSGVAGKTVLVVAGGGNAVSANNGANLTVYGMSATGQAGGAGVLGGTSSGTNIGALNAVTIQAAQCTGNATPGTIVFQTGNIAASGASQQVLATALTIAGPLNNLSGSTALLSVAPTWAATSSSAILRTLYLNPTINETSGTGNTEAFGMDVVDTSAPSAVAPIGNYCMRLGSNTSGGSANNFICQTNGQIGVQMQPLAPANASSSYNVWALSVNAGNSSGHQVALFQNTADTQGPSLFCYKNRATTFTTSTAVLAADSLGEFRFYGAAASSGATFYNPACSIQAFATQTFTSAASGGRFIVNTTPNNSIALTNRWCFEQDGSLKGTSGLPFGWVASSSDPTGSLDTAVSRDQSTAGVICGGTGAAGNKAGFYAASGFSVGNGTAVTSAGGIRWVTGLGVPSASAPQILFQTDQGGFISAASAGASSNGQVLTLSGGAGGATSGDSGAVTIQTQSPPTSGNSGAVNITTANANASNNFSGNILLQTGNSVGSGAGGTINIQPGSSVTGAAGAINALGGVGGSTSGNGGTVIVAGGNITSASGTGSGGTSTLRGGNVTLTSSAGNGGQVNVTGGNVTGTTTTGNGGAVVATGGLGGTTSGTGGAVSVTGGAGQGSTSGAGGLATLAGGAGSTGSNNNAAGGVTIDTGASSGSATALITFKLTSPAASGAAANPSQTLYAFSNGSGAILGATHGEQWVEGTTTELLTLSTGGLTTQTAGNLLPANSIILAVDCRVTTTITTTTNWAVGDATTTSRFSAPNATLTAGTTSVGITQMGATGAASSVQNAAAKVQITCTGSNPGAGVIRITVHYRQFTAPTS